MLATRIAVMVVVVILAITGPGRAQINTSTIVNNAISQTRFNLFMANSRFNLMMAEAQAASMRRAALAGKRLPRNSSATATTFVSSSEAIAPTKLASRYGKTAKEQEELAQLAHELLQVSSGSFKRSGARENDLAHILAYFLRMNYLVYSDGRGELTKEQADGLVEILRAFIVDYRPFRTMSDRDKQEHYETLAILGTYVTAAHDAARRRNDAALVASLRSMARNHIEEILGPIGSIALTRDGFMYR
jgi:hypothetical protein